jgi:hypothetical protein
LALDFHSYYGFWNQSFAEGTATAKGKSRRVNGGESAELVVPLLEGVRCDSLMGLWRVVPW